MRCQFRPVGNIPNKFRRGRPSPCFLPTLPKTRWRLLSRRCSQFRGNRKQCKLNAVSQKENQVSDTEPPSPPSHPPSSTSGSFFVAVQPQVRNTALSPRKFLTSDLKGGKGIPIWSRAFHLNPLPVWPPLFPNYLIPN